MPIWIYGVIVAFLAGLGTGWQTHSWKTDAATLAAQQKAGEDTAKTARKAFRIQENRDAGNELVVRQLADALERLRKRPDRVPAAATPACEGSTGAQLSGPDAAFLVREAARADRLRSELTACYEWVDAVGQSSTSSP